MRPLTRLALTLAASAAASTATISPAGQITITVPAQTPVLQAHLTTREQHITIRCTGPLSATNAACREWNAMLRPFTTQPAQTARCPIPLTAVGPDPRLGPLGALSKRRVRLCAGPLHRTALTNATRPDTTTEGINYG